MNLKLRLKNKATLAAILSAIVVFGYQVLAIFGITPSIGQSDVISGIGLVLTALVGMGVLVDPTTAGVTDSTQAMDYTDPKENEK